MKNAWKFSEMEQIHRIGATLLATLCLCGAMSFPAAAEETRRISGEISFVSADAVEVAGHRGNITSETDVISDGHPVAVTSLKRGMQAELEVDGANRAIEIVTAGVVE